VINLRPLTGSSSFIRRVLIAMAAVALLMPRAVGLIDLNEGRDKVTVHADYGISYDSNLFARSDSPGDTDQTLELGANYNRQAGVFGFSASASITTARFQRYSSQDYTNPSLKLSLNKNDGRLTGALAATAQRESSSDDAANIRANSWHYSANLSLRYPVNDRYYLTGNSDFSIRDYTPNTPLFNLSSYAESVDLYYIYSSKLDLLGGYRVRWGQAAGGTGTRDEAFTLGATGAILPKLSGTVRAGYQTRDESGPNGGHYDDLTGAFMLAWPLSKRITFNFQTSKDFMTAATDVSVDATSFDLSATVKPNLRVKIALTGEVGYTTSRYLGTAGDGREDRTLSFLVKLSVPIKDHFAAGLSFGYLTNASNFAISKYDRRTASLDLSVHF
jgi:Putative beta-barrel porin 2